MRLLWIPHTPWKSGFGRSEILLEYLSTRFEIHVVTCKRRPVHKSRVTFLMENAINSFRADTVACGSILVHNLSLPLSVVPAFIERMAHCYPPRWSLVISQLQFQHLIRELHNKYKFDAAVVASSHHMTGMPPLLPDVPMIFDYVDTSPDHIEAAYVDRAQIVVTVSKYLQQRVYSRYGRSAFVIPNGLDLKKIEAGDRERARQKWALAGKRVISLIGLTCSARLYFIDAMASIMKRHPDLLFLGVGQGRIATEIENRCKQLGVPCVMTGWIEPQQIADLFAATDIGLYPGDENSYFDGACPLKVLEYAGARVPIVASNSAELSNLGFDCLVLRAATAEAFADGLEHALNRSAWTFPDLSRYEWSSLAEQFERIITDNLVTA